MSMSDYERENNDERWNSSRHGRTGNVSWVYSPSNIVLNVIAAICAGVIVTCCFMGVWWALLGLPLVAFVAYKAMPRLHTTTFIKNHKNEMAFFWGSSALTRYNELTSTNPDNQ